jgi:predicted site-specific integrase-resolvase
MERGYNLNETAQMLGIKVRTARSWARTGKIEAKKIAGTNRWIVMESEIKRLQGELRNADHNRKYT